MYNIGICDDDKSTCNNLERIIIEYSAEKHIEVETFVWFSGEAMCRDLSIIDLDLIFLDIEMKQLSGIQVGEIIRNNLSDFKTSIIFISSKTSYSMCLFKIHPLDFLIKPLHNVKVYSVLDEYIKIYKQNNNFFEYKIGGIFYKIPYNEIVFFKSENKKINIILLKDEKKFYGKLKDIKKQLPDKFVVIHQSYIINQDYISECSYELVKMIDGSYLNISIPYRKQVREQIKKYNRERHQ